MSVVNKIRQVLAQEDTVLFIGSGLSQWSGLPSWPRLIEELAVYIEAAGANPELVRAEARRGDLLQAASYGFHQLTKPQIGEFIRRACSYGLATPHEIHRKLVTLGPRCFVTTNYDNLIEESLRRWVPHRFFRPPVTNRHLTETAEIVHARATDFVFKPHGDAADTESIILTREQYRDLMPGGERNAALESVKMLMASRPIIYFGFGLRDPDFMYLRDLLFNTYKGGTRDHYAIMADVVTAEIDYWRINYGIHLFGYTTTERPDGSSDHSSLLQLVNELAATNPKAAPATDREINPAEEILSLARHAARLMRAPKYSPEFPIRVSILDRDRSRDASSRKLYDEYHYRPVGRFLEGGPSAALLVGLPGAGKSYSMQRAAASLAQDLNTHCLSDSFDSTLVQVPILADFKLYRGSVKDLLNATLPTGLCVESLSKSYRLKIFLDSFNEMPREYWESGTYESDLAAFIAEKPFSSLIIGSRTVDGLQKTEFQAYQLDEIEAAFVEAELKLQGIEITGRFEREVHSLLQKPFYFQLVSRKLIDLPTEPHPRDCYRSFFDRLNTAFQQRFGHTLDLQTPLSLAAFKAIESGTEAQALSSLLEALQEHTTAEGIQNTSAAEMANWLVSQSIIIPYRGGRAAFFHQAITEYLAAFELAHRYLQSDRILKEKLALTRWDQALFLALSLLPPEAASRFLETVVDTDFALALHASKYVEYGREELVKSLLLKVPSCAGRQDATAHRIWSALEFGVPVSASHEAELRMIMKEGDMVGAAAVARLIQIKGATIKDEMLRELVENKEDYNYCRNGIAAALRPFSTNDDIRTVLNFADSLADEVPPGADDEIVNGFICGVAHYLSGLDLKIIREEFLPVNSPGRPLEIRARILCQLLWDCKSTAALAIAAELLTRGVTEAATAIYFIGKYPNPEEKVSYAMFSTHHIRLLINSAFDSNESSWSLKALKDICTHRPDLAEVVKSQALSAAGGIRRAALLDCAPHGDNLRSIGAAAELLTLDPAERQAALRLLDGIELDWRGHEDLFVQLLRLRDVDVALTLLGRIYPEATNIGSVEIGNIDWWLEWLAEVEGSTEGKAWFFFDRIGWFFGHCVKDPDRQRFVTEFNRSDSPFRQVLRRIVLPHVAELATDAFSYDAVSYLLADLNRPGAANGFRGQLLGQTATEQFVTEQLLPLLPSAMPPLLDNIRSVLLAAGSRHGRRYVSS